MAPAAAEVVRLPTIGGTPLTSTPVCSAFQGGFAVTTLNRRAFLAQTSLTAGAVTLAPFSRALGANDDLRIGVVGCGGQGSHHIRCLRELTGLRIVAVCDPDSRVLDRHRAEFGK